MTLEEEYEAVLRATAWRVKEIRELREALRDAHKIVSDWLDRGGGVGNLPLEELMPLLARADKRATAL